MKRRDKRLRAEEVNLNLAAMLDMAFQLLTFFILTFRPAPVEGNIHLRMRQMHLGASAVNAPPAGSSKASGAVLDESLRTLVVTAEANAVGELGGMRLGSGTTVGNLKRLEERLQAALLADNSPFDQVIIQASSELRYEALMSIVEVCSRQKLADGKRLQRLSFVELPTANM